MKRVSGLEALHLDYDALLIDAWGVLYDGGEIHGAARYALERLRNSRRAVVIVSNAARREAQLERELEQAGVERSLYSDVVSSGELTWRALRQDGLGDSAYYLGPARSRGLCDGLDFNWVESIEAADFVLNTGAPSGNPADAGACTPLLRRMRARGLPMVCANPDLVALRHGELGISAGAIAAAYRELGGRVISYGKPGREIFDMAMLRAGEVENHGTLMIGDAFATDIAGAANAEIDSLLITSGIHAAQLEPLDEAAVSRLAEAYAVTPTYFCDRFRW